MGICYHENYKERQKSNSNEETNKYTDKYVFQQTNALDTHPILLTTKELINDANKSYDYKAC